MVRMMNDKSLIIMLPIPGRSGGKTIWGNKDLKDKIYRRF